MNVWTPGLLLWLLTPMPLPAMPQDVEADVPSFSQILERTAERVREYYRDLGTLAWSSTVRQEVMEEDRTPRGPAVDVAFESIVTLGNPADGSPLPFFVREIHEFTSVNGERVGPDDVPGFYFFRLPISELLVLLPEVQEAVGIRISDAGRAEIDGRSMFLADIQFDRDEDDDPRVVWQGNTFNVLNPVVKNRVWIDSETSDVLRFDVESEPVKVSRFLFISVGEYSFRSTTRYTRVRLGDADDPFVVPDTYVYAQTVEKGREFPYVEATQTLSDFRVFKGDVAITPFDDPD